MDEIRFPENQIFLYDNVISEKCMNELKKFIDENADEEESYNPGSNVQAMQIHVDKIKDKKSQKYWDDKICRIVSKIYQNVCERSGSPEHVGDTGYQLRRIHGPTRKHTDGITGSIKDSYVERDLRLFSLIIALNDDYEGGEFHFPEQKTIIKLKAGQAILFPPYWTHPHYTGELNGTFRYTINTWITQTNSKKSEEKDS
jgi:hypothetical protein